jgi:hypothetical protein
MEWNEWYEERVVSNHTFRRASFDIDMLIVVDVRGENGWEMDRVSEISSVSIVDGSRIGLFCGGLEPIQEVSNYVRDGVSHPKRACMVLHSSTSHRKGSIL